MLSKLLLRLKLLFDDFCVDLSGYGCIMKRPWASRFCCPGRLLPLRLPYAAATLLRYWAGGCFCAMLPLHDRTSNARAPPPFWVRLRRWSAALQLRETRCACEKPLNFLFFRPASFYFSCPQYPLEQKHADSGHFVTLMHYWKILTAQSHCFYCGICSILGQFHEAQSNVFRESTDIFFTETTEIFPWSPQSNS